MVGPTEKYGHLHNVLARIPVSNGLRDGTDLGLIPDVLSVLSRRSRFGSHVESRLSRLRL